MWLRAWVLSYGYINSPHQEHLAIIEHIASQVGEKLESRDERTRLVARSVAHYLAQSAIRPARSRCITEALSWFLLPMMLCWWWLVSLWHPCPKQPIRQKGVRWLKRLFRYTMTPHLYLSPDELAVDEPCIVHLKADYYRWEDITFLWRCFREGWRILRAPHLQWCYKIAKEIVWIRPLIEHFPADYAFIDDEGNCALSVMTLYAHTHGMQLYVVQHGDLNLTTTTSFFETDRSYCWHPFYAELLTQLRVKTDFRIYQNPNFLPLVDTVLPKGVGVFLPSFVMTMPTDEDQRLFADRLNAIAKQYPVQVRPHPAFMNERDKLAPLLSADVEVTDPLAESSMQFTMRHRLVIGTASTALLEAVMLGREVVYVRGPYVDDLAQYHFAYNQPNTSLCALDELEETVAGKMAVIDLPMPGQELAT